MSYDLKCGDLLFIRGTGPIQSAIERITHSPYSHCAGIVKPFELLEAQALRDTGYAALDSYDGVADVYTCDTATDEQRQNIIQFVLSKRGTRYNYGLIGWEGLHFLFHVDLPIDDGDSYDCSDLWSEAYKTAGIVLRPDLAHVAPGDLAESILLRKVGPLSSVAGG